jgi:hypothetical protein
MSKTFRQLRAGDEVYVINGSDVEIVKVQSTDIKQYNIFIKIDGWTYRVPADVTSSHNDRGDIYCNIDDAMRKMQDICAKALHDYREASGALNKLETKKKMI